MDDEVNAGSTKTFYAWIGAEDGDKFDSDKFTAQTASASAKHAQDELGISSTINSHAFFDTNGQKVDLRGVSSVTFTVQLKNSDAGNVERAGVKFRVRYEQGPETGRSYTNTHEDELETNDEGQVSFTIQGPSNTSSDNSRLDDITFTELKSDGSAAGRMAEEDINWVEERPVLTKTTLEVPTYVMDGNPSVSAIVRLWDQYGNSHRSRSGQTADITIGAGDDNEDARTVISRGYARWSRKPGTTNITEGEPVPVTYDGVTAYARDADGYLLTDDGAQVDGDDVADGVQPTTQIYVDPDIDEPVLRTGVDEVYGNSDPENVTDGHQYRAAAGAVQVVNPANSASVDTTLYVTHVIADDNEFLTFTADTGDPTLVFSYDDDDTYIDRSGDEGREVTMEKFESLIDNNPDGIANGEGVTVVVLVYDADGTSVFTVTATGS